MSSCVALIFKQEMWLNGHYVVVGKERDVLSRLEFNVVRAYVSCGDLRTYPVKEYHA